MKCRNQLNISSKFNIANEYVLCRYKWHCPIVLIGHSFGRLVSKNLVVKLKRKSTIKNRINSKLACTCSLLFVQCFLQNQGKDRRIKENTLAQIEKNREKNKFKKSFNPRCICNFQMILLRCAHNTFTTS
jgi:hypothetical protein